MSFTAHHAARVRDKQDRKLRYFSEKLTERWRDALVELHLPAGALDQATVTLSRAKNDTKRLVAQCPMVEDFTSKHLETFFEESSGNVEIDEQAGIMRLSVVLGKTKDVVDFLSDQVLVRINPDHALSYAALLSNFHGKSTGHGYAH